MTETKKKNTFSYRHIGRYGEIASVLVRYGFGDLLDRIRIDRYFRFGKKNTPDPEVLGDHLSRWDRIRMALVELGPAFVKLGQFAANRPDFLPQDLIHSLEKLQDAVPPFDESVAVKIVEAELGQPIDKLFQSFDRQPFASASIAQVHRAILPGGNTVAVKVQRPQIADTISIDGEIMLHIATLMEKHIPGMGGMQPVKLVKEFTNAIRKELDFCIEAIHLKRFAENFRNDPTVHIPEVHVKFSARRVITTEFIEGIKITQIDQITLGGGDLQEIARRGAAAVLRQVFIHGFFHADPHAGNILVCPGNVICFLDLGMTGTLAPTARERLCGIVIGIARQHPQKIVAALSAMSIRHMVDKEDLEYEVAELIHEYVGRSVGNIDLSDILGRLMRLMSQHQIQLMPGFYLLIKALVTIQGIALKLDPGFNMMEQVEPFVKHMVKEYHGLHAILRDGRDATIDLMQFLRDLPSEARELLHLVKSGHIKIEFEHKGLDPITRKIDQMVNRIVFGLVLASLIVGSSIVILSDIPPKIYGLPLIGLAGFLAAGFMGFWLLISILRHEKM